MNKSISPGNLWLLYLVQDEVRVYIEEKEEMGEDISLMGFLEEFTGKCKQEREGEQCDTIS